MQIDVTRDVFKLAEVFTISRGSRTAAEVLTVHVEHVGAHPRRQLPCDGDVAAQHRLDARVPRCRREEPRARRVVGVVGHQHEAGAAYAAATAGARSANRLQKMYSGRSSSRCPSGARRYSP